MSDVEILMVGQADYEEWEKRLQECPAVQLRVMPGYGLPLYAAIDMTDDEGYILCGTHQLFDTLEFCRTNNLKICMNITSTMLAGECNTYLSLVGTAESWHKLVKQ